ncbi:hypothetical protein RIF29_34971 [Crotalaria pallida]|uniref:Uncharacterized protein n=1 Tax=Crotalaria pallida TaxID=3830 RepID=A0AAN9EF79_CROPI
MQDSKLEEKNTMTDNIEVIESFEWSYILVGGSLPNTEQKNLAFGAAASMVHPATERRNQNWIARANSGSLLLKELVRKSIAETQELKRFPTLQTEIAAAANEALERFREDSKKTTLRLVEMESSFYERPLYLGLMC